jgi:hypothetical protein
VEGSLKNTVICLSRTNVEIYDKQQISGANGLLYIIAHLFVSEVEFFLRVLLKEFEKAIITTDPANAK